MHRNPDPYEDQPDATTSGISTREAGRLAALDHLDAVRPGVDHVVQQLIDSVRGIFDADLCMVNLILLDVQYFRAWSGDLPAERAEARQDPVGRSMCQYVVENEGPALLIWKEGG